MRVRFTYIVEDETYVFHTLYETTEGRYFMTRHIVGQVSEINKEEAIRLIEAISSDE